MICALGIIFEYRFELNVFYDWSEKLLSGIFSVTAPETGAVDSIGRREVMGPAGAPLEAVAMLSMALPIALVGVIQADRWRGRILYGLAACLLLAATLATFRKSALLAPISVVLTVTYFRRQELLKLAPLALVLLIFVHVLAPGAIGSTTQQFDPERLGVTTVSDRTADYDAVRPDVWTHLALGRGWGSYEHFSYRILDSELLHRTIEMGVLGLLAYLFMGLSVVLSARATIASRDPTGAPLALIGAAAAVSFLVVSTLFDVLSFPHATYIFLYMAGLVAAVIGHHGDVDETAAMRLHGLRERRARRGSPTGRRPTADPATGTPHFARRVG
jgi:O-antigen ligase